MNSWLWLLSLLEVLTLVQAVPPGNPAPPLPNSTAQSAVIRGTVLNQTNGSPVAGVKISVSVPGHGGSVGSDTSDATGHYVIHVPPEKYSAYATKDGFVAQNYKDVADFPVLQANDGQETVADFRMLPGAAISGRVIDTHGSPIPNMRVGANMKRYGQGKVDLWIRGSAQTNAQGEYRIANLPSGRYFLQAIRNDDANKPGRQFEAVFYPAAARIDDAESLRVAVGEEKRSIDFRLSDAAIHSVSGRITFLDSGQPVPNMAIQVYPDYLGPATRASVDAQPDGAFRLDRLTAGRYRMEGKQRPNDYDSNASFLHFVEVTSGDIRDMAIHVGHGPKLQGTVQALGGRLPEQLSVGILFRDPVDDTRHEYVRGAPVSSADGTFEFMDPQPGIYDLVFSIPGISSTAERKFFVRTISVNGRDVMDTGISVPERSAPIQISATLDFQPGRILGKTLDSKDKPIPGARLALMRADRNKRRSNPYWKETTSDRDGSFRFSDVIPGDYLLIVWPDRLPGRTRSDWIRRSSPFWSNTPRVFISIAHGWSKRMCNSPKKFVIFWNRCCGDLVAVIRAPFLSNDNRQGFIDSAGPVPE
jgi:protocatechuate 3,4-dioxygenase beta subunit